MRVLLINLERSPERLAEFTAEAERAGLAFERLPAVDGRALAKDELAALIDPHFRFQPMGPGEAGVFLSHREAWRIAAKGPDRWTAVMEDDARLADDLPALLAAIEEIDPDAGIVRLETTLRKVVLDDESVALVPGRALHRMRSWHGGTAAYAIHHNAAADLIARSERMSDPLDQWLFNPLSPVFGMVHDRAGGARRGGAGATARQGRRRRGGLDQRPQDGRRRWAAPPARPGDRRPPAGAEGGRTGEAACRALPARPQLPLHSLRTVGRRAADAQALSYAPSCRAHRRLPGRPG